jgi:ketosteroid isomerase-like protein
MNMSMQASEERDVIEELRSLEGKRFAAMTNRDFDSLEELLDDRLCYTHSSGVRDTKDEYLRAVRDEVYVYGPVTHVENSITVIGDVAVITGEMEADIKVNGTPKKLRNAATAVWAHSSSTWRLLSYQTTPLPSA